MAAGKEALHVGQLKLTHSFAPLSARRLLVIGGILLILAGMLFGDIFAIFVLHQNAGQINQRLVAATRAVSAGDVNGVSAAFQDIGGFQENRGTKVDAHAHLIAFGYIALLLAVLQPFVSFSERARKKVAAIFLFGSALLPVGVFLIHYVGLALSPFAALGWASVAADFGGVLVAVAVVLDLMGLFRYWRRSSASLETATMKDALLHERSWCARALLAGGTFLILAGFTQGALYAGLHLYDYEAQDTTLVRQMATTAVSGREAETANVLSRYAQLQGAKAVNIAAHAHVIEFGVLCMLMALFQPYVYLGERWRRVWAVTLLAGSLMLPLFVLLELNLGLLAGGIADLGGLLVIVALAGMLTGIIRYTGQLDTTLEVTR